MVQNKKTVQEKEQSTSKMTSPKVNSKPVASVKTATITKPPVAAMSKVTIGSPAKSTSVKMSQTGDDRQVDYDSQKDSRDEAGPCCKESRCQAGVGRQTDGQCENRAGNREAGAKVKRETGVKLKARFDRQAGRPV